MQKRRELTEEYPATCLVIKESATPKFNITVLTVFRETRSRIKNSEQLIKSEIFIDTVYSVIA